jgi:hypothetical protein
MCPVGEIKKRKKEKQKLIKSMKVVTDINHQNEVAGRETPPINISQSTSASTTPAGPHHQRSGISNWIGSIFAR